MPPYVLHGRSAYTLGSRDYNVLVLEYRVIWCHQLENSARHNKPKLRLLVTLG